MKKIKVYLQYPWKFLDSPYYNNLIQDPPKGIEYLNIQKQKGVITSAKKFAYMNRLKKVIRATLSLVKMPNITKTKKGDYDLIHCAHCLSLNKLPRVVDLEHYWNFASSGKVAYSEEGKNRIKKLLKSEYCKKIIPWTEAAKKTIIDALNDKEIEKKVEVIYPAIPFPSFRKRKKEKIILLFVGRYFYWKGGLHALDTFDKITKLHQNVECIFVSEVPHNILKKYSANKKIKFYGLMTQEKLFKLYSESDLFVYPGYSDTVGFGILEAMSFGLPVISVDGFARKELIEDGKTGFIISNHEKINNEKIGEKEQEIIKRLIQKTSLLIENKNLREKMSKECIKSIKEGKFSIKERNKKLEKIYELALK